MKKLSFILLAIICSIGMSWADWSLSYKLDGGSWNNNIAPQADGNVYLNLAAESTYYIYTLIDGNGYASADATMTEGNSSNYNLIGYDDATYTQLKITTTRAGVYRFYLSYYSNVQHITAVYPGNTEYNDFVYTNGWPSVTWETNRNGDVVINLYSKPGASNATFRNGAFEGNMNGFTVLSGDNFATSEAADTYFTREWADGSSVFYLRLKSGVNLPSPCKIKFTTNAMAWTCDENNNAYGYPTYEYTYGTIKKHFDVPTSVGVDAEGRVSFSCAQYGVSANTYEARIYDASNNLKATQTVNSGDILNFVPTSTETYKVKVVAYSGDMYMSEESAVFNWALTAGTVFGTSKYCGYLFNATAANEGWPIYMTWETLSDGKIQITILPHGDEGTGETAFRSLGMDLTKFTINGTALTNEFTKDYTGNVLTLTPTANAPAKGAVIGYNGYVEYKTGVKTNAWPTLTMNDYIYGTYASQYFNVSEAEWASLCIPYNAAIPANVEAYIITGRNGNAVTLSQITGVIPAATGFLAHAVSGSYKFVTSSGAPSNVSSNMLKGTLSADETTTGGDVYYRLSKHDGQVGFYWGAANGAAFQPGANKAYLAISSVGAPTHFNFEDEEQTTTEIESIEANNETVKFVENGQILIRKNGVVYTVLGQIVK